MSNPKRPRLVWTVIVLLSIAIIGVAWLSTNKTPKVADNWAPPFKGLQWGMSKNEVLGVLKLKQGYTEKSHIPYIENELFGTKVTASFSFQVPMDNQLTGKGTPGDALMGITIQINEKDVDIIEKEITKMLGKGKYNYSDFDGTVLGISWNSPLIKERQEYVDIVRTVLNSFGSETYESLGDKYIERSLVSYYFNIDKSDDKYGRLTINGSSAAFINAADKFMSAKIE
jgi:hypothetical protein